MHEPSHELARCPVWLVKHAVAIGELTQGLQVLVLLVVLDVCLRDVRHGTITLGR